MRVVGLVIVLAACGRIGFDEGSVDGGAPGFRSLCDLPKVRIIQDGITVDDGVGNAVANLLVNECSPGGPVVVPQTVSQDDAGVLASNGRPLLAPDLLAVIPGGDGPQRAIAYALTHDTPVIWDDGNPVTITERATGSVIVNGPIDNTHDYIVVQTFTEPVSGGHVLSVAGDVAEGTIAARIWFQSSLAPQIRTEVRAWFVVEWTDDDGTTGATAGDTFTVVASGP